MNIAISNVIIKNDLLIGIASVKWAISKPNQLVNGPGIIGRTLPIIPKIINKAAIIIKIISINVFKFYNDMTKNYAKCYILN